VVQAGLGQRLPHPPLPPHHVTTLLPCCLLRWRPASY
jgi:hypothetical protein